MTRKAKTSQTVLLVALLAFFGVAVNAQTKKSKRKPVLRTVAAQPTPTPITEPLIISRAEDYPLNDDVLPQAVTEAVRLTNDEDRSASERTIVELTERIKALETFKKDDYDQKQKRLAMNLEILTKAEQRAESLRKQSFEMFEKENSIKTRLDQLEADIRPESIERNVAFAGTLRPEDLRAARKKSLEAERTNLNSLLAELQRTRTTMDLNVQKADLMVERLRQKLEAEIDAALSDDPQKL